jgi:hypothetical protein
MRTLRLALLSTVAVLALAACVPFPHLVEHPVALPPSADPTAEPTVTPSTEPTANLPTRPVRPPNGPVADAGVVAAGVPVTVSGTGDSQIDYTRDGTFPVVAALDCSQCTGEATFTALDRIKPYGEAEGPMTGTYLLDVLSLLADLEVEDDSSEQPLFVDAEGPWTLTLSHWDDLEPVSGPQSGSGATVLRFTEQVKYLEVSYEPSGAGDDFTGRYFRDHGGPLIFGNDTAYTKSYSTDSPGVLAISTNGTWTATPRR